MIKRPELTLVAGYTLEHAQRDIEKLEDESYKHQQNLTLLAEGLAMALAEIRHLRGDMKPDE